MVVEPSSVCIISLSKILFLLLFTTLSFSR
jgi:hypothetical protein